MPLFVLGAIWPSLFTIAALLALPAGIVLLAAIARPSLLSGSMMRAYCRIAVVLSPLCLLIEILWVADRSDVPEYKVIRSSALLILEAGKVPAGGCAEVGTVSIPRRNPSFVDRHLGLGEEEFHRALDEQLKPLGANVLVPHAGSDVFAAGSSGQPFEGTAYSCP